MGRALTVGSVALILGHGRAWEHIRQQNFPFGLVMEDDVTTIHPQLQQFLCSWAKKPAHSWDYLQLQPCDNDEKINVSQSLQATPGTEDCMGMYAITREAAT